MALVGPWRVRHLEVGSRISKILRVPDRDAETTVFGLAYTTPFCCAATSEPTLYD